MSDSPAARPDPDRAPLAEIDRELASLVREYRTASHVVAEQPVRPDGIDDATLSWWVTAHQAVWKRWFEVGTATTSPAEKRNIELRKDRLRKPPH